MKYRKPQEVWFWKAIPWSLFINMVIVIYTSIVWNWNWVLLPTNRRSTVKSLCPLTLSFLICIMCIIVTTLQVWYMDLP